MVIKSKRIMKKECKHERQTYTKVMRRGQECEAYNTCRDCYKKLSPDIERAEMIEEQEDFI